MADTPKTDILLVDDEPRNLLALQQLLEAPDRNLVLAGSGDEALRAVLKCDFAVILLDVRMPALDGFETAKLIRGRTRSRQTPIIFVTGVYEDVSSVSRGYEVGAVDYILKPIVPDVLKSKVSVFVELYRKTAELNRQKEALRAEARASGQRFYDLVQGLDAIVWEARADQNRFSFVSQRAESMLGYSVGRWLAEPDFRTCIIHHDDATATRAAYERAYREGGTHALEYRVTAADGRELWLRDHVYAKHGGDGDNGAQDGHAQVRGVMVDITRQKEIEAALAGHSEHLEELVEARTADLSALSAHLENVREEEKAGLARELHDELGSILTALALDVSWLQKRMNNSGQPFADKLQAVRGLIDSAVKTTRGIMQDLRPTLLDDVGIAAAISWQSQEFSKRNGIACKLELFDEQAKLDEMRSISLFRILQEALTNITRHAQASEVRIVLRSGDDGIALEVHDNGIGIAANDAHKPMSHGLTGMRERVRRLGGRIAIAAPSGGGTLIEVVLPAAIAGADGVLASAGDPAVSGASLSIVSR